MGNLITMVKYQKSLEKINFFLDELHPIYAK